MSTTSIYNLFAIKYIIMVFAKKIQKKEKKEKNEKLLVYINDVYI